MIDPKETLNVLYDDTIMANYNLEEIEKDELESAMDDKDYIIYLCHKLQYWLEVNKIYKICNYFNTLTKFMTRKKIKFSELDDCCQIVITAAKFYVKGVYRVKEVYHL